MKMKVKKSQRLMASLIASYLQFCCCVIYLLVTVCLLESIHLRMHVNAYINGAINVTNSFQHLNTQHFNGSEKRLLSNRNGRFLFDALFGLTPPLNAASFADDDDDEEEPPKPCKCEKKACGQSNQETRIVGGKPTGVNVRVTL